MWAQIDSLLLQFDAQFRVASFLGVFVIFMVCEMLVPRRKLIVSKRQRWYSNLAIIGINSLLLRLIFPGFLVAVSLFATKNNIGVLNYFVSPLVFSSIISILCLDLAIYVQHVVFHKVNILWALHKVHHVDLDLDVTTGLRFHPFEIIISLFIKTFMVLVLGAPAIGVVLFQIMLNITSMFNHSNIKLPESLDRIIRYFMVTPDMHLVHHSDIMEEHNSNYGFNLSIWDKIFKTYLVRPKLGVDGVNIGVLNYKHQRYSKELLTILLLPFYKRK